MEQSLNDIKDLEVLSKYLSEEELKEVAKDVAKELFRNSMSLSNPNAKSNVDFYAKQGAYLAVKEYAEVNDEIDFKEMSKSLNKKVDGVIKGLQSYQLGYDYILNEAVENRREDIQRRVDEILNNLLQDEENYSGVYKRVEGDLGYVIAEHLMEHFKKSFNVEPE